MSLLVKAKNLIEHTPYPIGRLLSRIPYSWRLGPVYANTLKDIAEFDKISVEEKKRHIFERCKCILAYAYKNNAFYKSFYLAKGFDPNKVQRFEDIERIPIVTKSDLRAVSLEERSNHQRGRICVNTGGTSGEPLQFYLDRHAFAREWAHMHTIWSKGNYATTDLKLTFRGKNLGRDAIRYNAVHNEYYVNAYISPEVQVQSIKPIARKVRFIHGYPSSVYEFVRYCVKKKPELLEVFRMNLKGVLLGSEYPAPVFRDLIEDQLDTRCICWYGHSEFAIFAPDIRNNLYIPFHCYGYCEAIPDGTEKYRLIGTSYYNTASPFIRYDTGDLVTPMFDKGLLAGFSIEAGRIGDFVEDANGNRISLTSLIFGRHHPIFGQARFVQIRQENPGKATLIVSLSPDHGYEKSEVRAGFDLSNVAIDFSIEIREKPLRSPSGKVPLLVQEKDALRSPKVEIR